MLVRFRSSQYWNAKMVRYCPILVYQYLGPEVHLFPRIVWLLSSREKKGRNWLVYFNSRNDLNMYMTLKGRVMGPVLALVCCCFRKNVINCRMQKLCLFHVVQTIFFLKNVTVFNFGNTHFKMALIWKQAILTHFSYFLVTREKTEKFLHHIS